MVDAIGISPVKTRNPKARKFWKDKAGLLDQLTMLLQEGLQVPSYQRSCGKD